MRRLFGWQITVMTTVWLITPPVMGAVPPLIPVQGYLVDDQGVPLNGSFTITFSLYSSQTSSVAQWSETRADVPIAQGHFAIYLGRESPLDPGGLIAAPELWLAMAVEGDVESNRLRLAAVPFALEALSCQQIDGLDGSQLQPVLTDACAGGTFLQGWDSQSNSPICAPASPPDHQHDDRYAPREALSTPGVVNEDDNLVSWGQLLDVPAGIADGVDDVGVYSGDDFALSDQACEGGQFARGLDEHGLVICEDDQLGTYSGDDFAPSDQYCPDGQLAWGINANGSLACEADQDTLAGLSCTSGELAKWDSVVGWICQEDVWSAPYAFSQAYDAIFATISTTWNPTDRTVAYSKQSSSTVLKITFSDNFYIGGEAGVQKQCEWKITIDGGDCTDPTKLEYYFTTLSELTHEFRSATHVGICRATAGGPIPAGGHTITVYSRKGNDQSSCELGNNSTGLLLVEELPEAI